MPIKFRCVHCNKLLGIARRKAGTIVDCPQCHQQLIVPTPSEPEPEPDSDQPTVQPEPAPRATQRLFEQDQFSLDLDDGHSPTYRHHDQGPATYAPPPTFAAERHLPIPSTVASPAPNPVPLPMPYPLPATSPPVQGLVLSGSKIMLILIVLFFVIAAAFGAGVFVGKSLTAAAGS